MIDIVGDRNVLAENLLPDPVVQERTLVEQRHAAKIPEHEAHQIEHRRRLQDYGVLARGQLRWIRRTLRFFGRLSANPSGIDLVDIGRIALLPARGVLRQHGYRGFGQRLRVV